MADSRLNARRFIEEESKIIWTDTRLMKVSRIRGRFYVQCDRSVFHEINRNPLVPRFRRLVIGKIVMSFATDKLLERNMCGRQS